MVGLCWPIHPLTQHTLLIRNSSSFSCCYNKKKREKAAKAYPTPQPLKAAVSALTELLRFFSAKDRLETVDFAQKNQVLLSSVDDVLRILECDYENAYFVTGLFTSAIYSEDCLFEDPTIRFRGTELYARNLKLLVPFFDHPSIALQNIEKDPDCERIFILATWKLRTFLRLPWRPLISINGETVYDLDENFKVIRHAESWDVSALEAIGQIFTPSRGRSSG